MLRLSTLQSSLRMEHGGFFLFSFLENFEIKIKELLQQHAMSNSAAQSVELCFEHFSLCSKESLPDAHPFL